MIAPRDLHYFRASAQHVLASVAASQNGIFFLRIAHIAHSLLFSTKGIFSHGPKGFECILAFVHAAESRN